MSVANLAHWMSMACEADRVEGGMAYPRYHMLLRQIATMYEADFERTVAAFVALSPNNSYHGNLRSLVSVLVGYNSGLPPTHITVSTYSACKERALKYLRGLDTFDAPGRGLKTLSFYRNILDPTSDKHVTVDGHISAAWRGFHRFTMREAIVRSTKEYRKVEADVKTVAADNNMLPCGAQATIWFARKRHFGVLFNAQLDLFHGGDDQHRTQVRPEDIRPYTRRE